MLGETDLGSLGFHNILAKDPFVWMKIIEASISNINKANRGAVVSSKCLPYPPPPKILSHGQQPKPLAEGEHWKPWLGKLIGKAMSAFPATPVKLNPQ